MLAQRARTLHRLTHLLLLVGWLLSVGGCGDDSDGTPPAAPVGRVLVVGDAHGAVLDEIRSQYATAPGTGAEDPAPFDMIIFDGDETAPDELLANPGAANFLAAGKAVVVLNDTEAHRSSGLGALLWAHAEGASPAVAFLIGRDSAGVAQDTVQVNFPLRIEAAVNDVERGECPPTLRSGRRDRDSVPTTPSDAELKSDSRQWLALVQDRLRGGFGSIEPAATGPGQTVLSFHDVTPATLLQNSVLNDQPAPPFTAWGRNGTQPPDFSTAVSATFETRLYAILEGNSATTFQHKIIARQYLLVSPPDPLATTDVTTQYAIVGSNWDGTWPVYSTLGFSSSFLLDVQLVNSPLLGVIENLPEATNHVTQLTTSQSHTEMVGLSATFGVQNRNPLGTISASWSQSWAWGQTSSVSFSDWESGSTVDIANNEACYDFFAFGGSDVTAAVLGQNRLELPPNNEQIQSQPSAPFYYYPPTPPGLPSFNQLQTAAMTNKSETIWATSSGKLVPPQTVQLISTAHIHSGELLELLPGVILFQYGVPKVFTGLAKTPLTQPYDLNFAAPALHPPAVAPWTLTFDEPSPVGENWAAAGRITLNAPQAVPTTISVTWVVEPKQAILTLPASGVCPGNELSFNPSADVVSNAPLSVTIPAGQIQADLAPQFESIGEPYNVQVIAWQYSTNVAGSAVLNPQAAYCLTIPE